MLSLAAQRLRSAGAPARHAAPARPPVQEAVFMLPRPICPSIAVSPLPPQHLNLLNIEWSVHTACPEEMPMVQWSLATWWAVRGGGVWCGGVVVQTHVCFCQQVAGGVASCTGSEWHACVKASILFAVPPVLLLSCLRSPCLFPCLPCLPPAVRQVIEGEDELRHPEVAGEGTAAGVGKARR